MTGLDQDVGSRLTLRQQITRLVVIVPLLMSRPEDDIHSIISDAEEAASWAETGCQLKQPDVSSAD